MMIAKRIICVIFYDNDHKISHDKNYEISYDDNEYAIIV